jgi:hypothetical protein
MSSQSETQRSSALRGPVERVPIVILTELRIAQAPRADLVLLEETGTADRRSGLRLCTPQWRKLSRHRGINESRWVFQADALRLDGSLGFDRG